MENPAGATGGAVGGRQDSRDLAASQGFVAECQARGWTVETVSPRVLKVSKAGSVLFLSAHPEHFAEALERVRDSDAFAMRHFRP